MIIKKLLLFVIYLPLMGHMLFDPNEKPHSALNQLFCLTGIKEGNFQSIVDQTQALYLRKQGTERWDINPTNHEYHEEIRQLYDNYLKNWIIFTKLNLAKRNTNTWFFLVHLVLA